MDFQNGVRFEKKASSLIYTELVHLDESTVALD